MNIRFLPLILISSFVFAQEDTAQPAEPIITDLDRLVESVKKTASSRSAEDNARLQRFLADKNRQQYLLNQMKANLKAEENRSARLTKEYEDNDARLADLEEQLTLKLGSFGEDSLSYLWYKFSSHMMHYSEIFYGNCILWIEFQQFSI